MKAKEKKKEIKKWEWTRERKNWQKKERHGEIERWVREIEKYKENMK